MEIEATEKAFDFVALPVQFLAEFLRILVVRLGRDHVNRALFPDQQFPPTLELAGSATTLGVRHELDLL